MSELEASSKSPAPTPEKRDLEFFTKFFVRPAEGLVAFPDRPVLADRGQRYDLQAKIGFKDESGKMVIEPKFFLWVGEDFGLGTWNGGYRFRDGVASVLTATGYGLIDKTGNFIGRHDYRRMSLDHKGKRTYDLQEPVLWGLGIRSTYGKLEAPSWTPEPISITYHFDNGVLRWSQAVYLETIEAIRKDDGKTLKSMSNAFSAAHPLQKFWILASIAGVLVVLALLYTAAYRWCRTEDVPPFAAAVCAGPIVLGGLALAGFVIVALGAILGLVMLAFAFMGGTRSRR